MTDPSVEGRLDTLEQQVREIVAKINTSDAQSLRTRDWRQSLGMFDDRPLMKKIDEEGSRIRQQDREQVANDHS